MFFTFALGALIEICRKLGKRRHGCIACIVSPWESCSLWYGVEYCIFCYLLFLSPYPITPVAPKVYYLFLFFRGQESMESMGVHTVKPAVESMYTLVGM